MKVKLISSPQGSLSLFKDKGKYYPEIIDYIFEIEFHDFSLLSGLLNSVSSFWRMTTSHQKLEFSPALPPGISSEPEQARLVYDAIADSYAHYVQLVDYGASESEAAEIIPGGLMPKAIVKVNLKKISVESKFIFSDYENAIIREIKSAIGKEHPWAIDFINSEIL